MLNNIVIINDYASVQGGAAQVAVKSAIGLANSGFSVYFIYAAGKADQALVESGVSCICLDQFDLTGNPSKFRASIDGVWNFEVGRRVSSVLKGFSAEDTVVHIHSWVKSLSVSVLSAVHESGIGAVLTLHDYFSACPNGGFYNYNTGLVCEKKAMSLGCWGANCDSRSYIHKIWRNVRHSVYPISGFPNSIKNFITVSDVSENILKPYLPREAKFWRIPNPIETVRMPPAKPAKSNKFTFLGRLSPEKGVLILSDLKNIASSQLRFVGSGELEPLLREKLPDAEFSGWCQRDEILKILDDTRALLFTSNLYETQGLVVLEAASRGVPALVSNRSAASEFIEDNVSGVLFDTGDPSSLDSALLSLKDDFFVERLGENAYAKFWMDAPTLESHLSKLIDCYFKIIKN